VDAVPDHAAFTALMDEDPALEVIVDVIVFDERSPTLLDLYALQRIPEDLVPAQMALPTVIDENATLAAIKDVIVFDEWIRP